MSARRRPGDYPDLRIADISGGGSLIQNETSTRSLNYYLTTIRMAHAAGCRVGQCRLQVVDVVLRVSSARPLSDGVVS